MTIVTLTALTLVSGILIGSIATKFYLKDKIKKSAEAKAKENTKFLLSEQSRMHKDEVEKIFDKYNGLVQEKVKEIETLIEEKTTLEKGIEEFLNQTKTA